MIILSRRLIKVSLTDELVLPKLSFSFWVVLNKLSSLVIIDFTSSGILVPLWIEKIGTI